MLKIGGTEVADVRLGNTQVNKVYLGSDLIWEKSAPLPYDAEVEYLESDGTAYIDTGIKSSGNINIKIRLVDYFTNSFGSKWAFGGRTASSTNMFGFFINGNSYKVVFAYNKSASANTYNVCTTYPSTADVEIGNGTVKIGNTTHSYTQATFASGVYNVILFGLNNGGTVIHCPAKIGRTYLTNGTTTFDWIPVRKNGVGYFYDRISGQLHGNDASSGAFSYGNDVT